MSDQIKKKIGKALNEFIYDCMKEVYQSYLIRKKETINTSAIKRVALISTPRSGSKLLCELLMQRGLGIIREFFHDQYEKSYREIAKKESCSLHAYYEQIVLGAFGRQLNTVVINFHGCQIFERIRRGLAIDDLAIDYFIYIERKDVLAQAYSLVKARKSDVWSDRTRKRARLDDNDIDVAIDRSMVERAMKEISVEKRRIKEYFSNRICKTVYYEELVSEKREILLKEIFDNIGIDYALQPLSSLPMMRQTTAKDLCVLEQLREELNKSLLRRLGCKMGFAEKI